jgi:hypothetical protein
MCVCMYVDRIDLDDDVKDFLTVDRWFDEWNKKCAFMPSYIIKIDACQLFMSKTLVRPSNS